ncbi:hypothetical protein BJ508DRAFT_335767 [Ascobolus immersus RN42]|uniref:Uncharacterized protein n=1 Tax=Ascobolus immersus RN42 TaxID=1160509 RepID=A0A3N4HDJ9_ASCIM|nr:hypothetical protein BJ508DRAFT_335767 [Ascobolus immersus RN42]
MGFIGLLRHIHKLLTGKGMPRGENEDEKLFFSEQIWVAIGGEQMASGPHYPTSFGDLFNIHKAWTGMKAANWFSWAIQQCLVYLRTGLNTQEEYDVMKKVVFAVELASRRTLTFEEVDVMERLFEDFLEYFELEIYRCEFDRIGYAKPTYHQVAKHAGQGIRMCGPMPGYWQFKMEEFIGMLGTVRSYRYPNESLFNYVFIQELLKLVPYILPPLKGSHSRGGVAGMGLDTADGEGYCDRSTGRLQINKIFRYFKARLIEDYKLRQKTLPWELNRATTGTKTLNREHRAFQHDPLSLSLGTLPVYPQHPIFTGLDASALFPGPMDGRGTSVGLDGQHLLSPPPNFDIEQFSASMLDFDLHTLQPDGTFRPFARLPRDGHTGRRPPIIPAAPDHIPSLSEFDKEVRVYQPVRTGVAGSELTDREKQHVLRFLHSDECRDRFPATLLFDAAATAARRPYSFDQLDERFDLCPIKWKAMDITYPSSRQSYAGVHGFVNRTSIHAFGSAERGEGFTTRSDRERSAAYVHYLDTANKGTGGTPVRNKDSNIGIVRFFLTLETGRLLSASVDHDPAAAEQSENPNANTHVVGEQQHIVLAYIDRLFIEETSDRFLLRVSADGTRRMENRDPVFDGSHFFIPAVNICELVGFLKCNNREYVVWKDGCWTTEGRDEIIQDARRRI